MAKRTERLGCKAQLLFTNLTNTTLPTCRRSHQEALRSGEHNWSGRRRTDPSARTFYSRRSNVCRGEPDFKNIKLKTEHVKVNHILIEDSSIVSDIISKPISSSPVDGIVLAAGLLEPSHSQRERLVPGPVGGGHRELQSEDSILTFIWNVTIALSKSNNFNKINKKETCIQMSISWSLASE